MFDEGPGFGTNLIFGDQIVRRASNDDDPIDLELEWAIKQMKDWCLATESECSCSAAESKRFLDDCERAEKIIRSRCAV